MDGQRSLILKTLSYRHDGERIRRNKDALDINSIINSRSYFKREEKAVRICLLDIFKCSMDDY